MSGAGRKTLDWLAARLNLTEIFSLLTSYGLFYAELDTRKPIREALAEVSDQPMPSSARWPRVLSLMAVALIALEIATGGLLAFYYLPTPESAHASVGTVLHKVDFGWLIHQLHFWGAQVLLAILMLRVVRFFANRVYRRPAELIWVFGILLLLVVFHADLTGRLLPFSSGAYWSTVRALEVIAAVPLYGSVVLFLTGGGDLISDFTLVRFYVLHVAVLPMLAVLFIYLHFSTVRRTGFRREAEAADRARRIGGGRAVRFNLANLAIVLVALTGVVMTLAVLVPVPFHHAADPFATVPGVGPPWYLLAPFGFLEWSSGLLPKWVAGAVLFLSFVALIALPFLERTRDRSRSLTLVRLAGLAVLAAWVFFTYYGARVA